MEIGCHRLTINRTTQITAAREAQALASAIRDIDRAKHRGGTTVLIDDSLSVECVLQGAASGAEGL